jgi:hypothetical protein
MNGVCERARGVPCTKPSAGERPSDNASPSLDHDAFKLELAGVRERVVAIAATIISLAVPAPAEGDSSKAEANKAEERK